ncbi:MAG: cellulase family glycosylhydrolase, partial [Acidimicrobiales bacterium]
MLRARHREPAATVSRGRALTWMVGSVLTAIISAAACCVLPLAGQASAATRLAGAGTKRPPYIAAAQYFGAGDPYNLWSSDMSGAPQALAQMKRNGFNAVALVVPWGRFQTRLTPPRYDQEAFSRLNTVIGDAKKLHMGVLLRISYYWDMDPADQMPTSSRFDALWSNKKVYAAWLDYVGKLHQDVAGFGNVWEAYLSWEDLWQPVTEAESTTTPSQQMALAGSTGYRSWLASQSHLSLAQVGADYDTQFASFS